MRGSILCGDHLLWLYRKFHFFSYVFGELGETALIRPLSFNLVLFLSFVVRWRYGSTGRRSHRHCNVLHELILSY